ncbi:MAG: hypothetical protein H6736_08010 [Alphaproteobacteria bacterium]|nr:hypothetical protein [Alphaproteobacteria bacterium]MCB9691743.1 hypothetical protein [Alphaproteobacteria bacterium]
MLPLYLASLGFGSVLIGVSLFFGGADKDFDKDLDLDGDGDVDLDAEAEADLDLEAEAEVDLEAEVEVEAEAVGGDLQAVDHAGLADVIWIPIFSMRFWTFGSAAFGFTGVVLTLGALNAIVTLLVAGVFGTGTGTAAAYFFKALKKDSVTGTTSLKGYRGEEARVVLPIEPGGRGKIVLETASGYLELIATTKDDTSIPRGATVLIAGVRDGVADVSALTDKTDEVARRKRITARDPA